MNYPSTLTIKVADKVSGQTIPQIAVIVTFFAAEKSDYHIARVTNADGQIPLTINEVRDSIDRDQTLFLMDYASTIEECSDELEIEVCDNEQIRRTIEAMEMYKEVTDIDGDLITGFKNSVNGRYVVPIIQRTAISPNVGNVTITILPLAPLPL